MEILQTQLLGNSLQSWLIALTIALAVMSLAYISRCLISRQIKKLAERSETLFWPALAAAVRRTKWLFIAILSLYIGTVVLLVPDKSRALILTIVVVAFILQIGLWAGAALQAAIDLYRRQQLNKDPASVTTLNVINFIGRILIWSIVLLLVLDNAGVNITALIAGLGVGGVAVALALQTVLGDLFASLSIVLDKPFVVGDFLIVGDLLGSVEYVGLKTTRLRSLSGEQLVFSNSDLLNSRIRNFGRMFERRVSFNIGVTYQTPRDKLV